VLVVAEGHDVIVPAAVEVNRGRVTVLTVCAVAAVGLAGSMVAAGYEAHGPGRLGTALVGALVAGTIAVVGAIVALVEPRNLVGWLMLCGAALLGVGNALTEAGVRTVQADPAVRDYHAYLAAIGPGFRGAGWIAAAVVVPTFFPDGRLLSRRWRWVGFAAAGAVIGMLVDPIISPGGQETRLVGWHNPLGLPAAAAGLANAADLTAIALTVVTGVAALISQVARFRRAAARVRQQILLLAMAAIPPVAVVLLVIVTGDVPPWGFFLAELALPIAIAVAMLSYGLYDLRRATHHALVWLIMSGALLAVYAGVVAGVTAAAGRTSVWVAPVIAAIVAAMLLLPLRDVAQRAVSRVVYGRWREPYEVLAGLGQRLAGAADLDRLIRDAIAELAAALDLGDIRITGIPPSDVDDSNALQLVAYGRPVGWLEYTTHRPLGTAELRLLGDLAHELGAALHAQAMRTDLQRARERLVLAREDERRRLRRDLHDGIGPALAGLTLRVATIARMLPEDAATAAQRLEDLTDDIRRTVVDVRHLVEALRPPALDELGLVAACAQAIERLVAGQLDVTIDSQPLTALPAAVEVAAYRIIVEAVTNAVRHSGGRRCGVSIHCDHKILTVNVTDDGEVADRSRLDGGGNGIAIMRERAEELGGRLSLETAPTGTIVRAALPIPQAAST
jgi:signal transduction histidine kinase